MFKTGGIVGAGGGAMALVILVREVGWAEAL